MRSFRQFKFVAVAILLTAVSVAGCRREDVRTVAIDVPGISETNRAAVTAALFKYAGVKRDGVKIDQAAGKVTVVYDSMQVAQTNLRMALEAKGFKVVFPENTTGRAGY